MNQATPNSQWNYSIVAAVALIVSGGIFLLRNFDVIDIGHHWWAWFMLIPIAYTLSSAWRRRQENGGTFPPGRAARSPAALCSYSSCAFFVRPELGHDMAGIFNSRRLVSALGRAYIMKIGVIPENIFERLALAAGLVPTPLVDSWLTFMLARAIMIATKLGIFETLAETPATPMEIASRCGTQAHATEKLLNALVGFGLVTVRETRYSLTSVARKWLLRNSFESAHDKIIFQCIEWDWWNRCEDYIRTGKPILMHEEMNETQWQAYQQGMRSGIEPLVKEVTRRLRLPKQAKDMLDIGGSHGHWSATFCRRYPNLRATILDLEVAIRYAAPILAKEGMGDRVVHRAGNALTDDLGEAAYDFVFISSLVHHFDDATNRTLMKKAARTLRPGGVVAIVDALRVDPSQKIRQIGGLLDFYFAMMSESGTWSAEEMMSWQREAHLLPRQTMRLRLARDVAVQAAVKPS
jgi:predicted O-methyltransferase YrrM